VTHAKDFPQAYLLRLRRLDNGGQPLWLFILESTDGRSQHRFRDLAALTEFLAQMTGEGDE